MPISVAWGEKKGRGEASQPAVSKRGDYEVQRCYYNRWLKMTTWDRDIFISFKEEEKFEEIKNFQNFSKTMTWRNGNCLRGFVFTLI